MTRERIEDFREIVLPFVKKRLLEINYENLGESDAEMFVKDFDEILNLAIKALEQEPFMTTPCISSKVCEHDRVVTLDKIRAEIEQLPTNTRINWDGCCPDIDYPEIEYVDVSKAGLLEIINKYKADSEGKE